MAAKLIWTETALQDLEAVVAFIAKDSPHYAALTADRIIAKVERLREYPRLGRVVPEFDDPNIRQVFWRQYRIVYALRDEDVCVIAIAHGARPLDMHLDRDR